MARKIIETISDDIDGTEGAETISFSLDGTAYEIDLAERNANKLYDALKPYREAGRKVGASRAPSASKPRSKASRSKDELAAIRAWATYAGKEVSERGRIPQAILDEFDAAHKK